MEEYKRQYPAFALCGLNCCLCPRFHTDGPSRCPGCGGPDFHLKHPACAVITCSKKHGSPEFCFACPEFPCKRFPEETVADSFITYRNVRRDLECAKKRLTEYLATLDRKQRVLKILLGEFDDGRRKSFYCTAVNLLPVSALEKLLRPQSGAKDAPVLKPKEKAALMSARIQEAAKKLNVDLVLRRG